MRAPFQEGDFPGPVKYGYLNVGVVEEGPAGAGRPHRLLPVPAPGPLRGAGRARSPRCRTACRPARAVLAGDGGDRGQRAVGRRAAGRRPDRGGRRRHGRLLRRRGCWPGCPARGCSWSTPTRAGRRSPRRSASTFAHPATPRTATAISCCTPARTSAGLTRSLELLGAEGEVIELSWYGDRPVSVPLGEAFHSRRLTIRSSQVGAVAPARRARRSHADRLALALDLLADPAFDALITGECRVRRAARGAAPAGRRRAARAVPPHRLPRRQPGE